MKLMPSTNPCPEEDLIKYCKALSKLNVTFMHCDVMDGRFVENKCLELDKIKQIRDNVNIGLDIHLMVEDSLEYVKKCIELKPNFVTIHYESPKSIKEIETIIHMLHKKGILCGMSIKPNTPISMLEPFIRSLDMVLIMTVEPGKSGQTFLDGSMDRIREAKALIDRLNHFCKLEVDGGVTEGRLENLRKAGVDYVVMGSNLYNAKDKKAIVAQFDD